VSSSAALTLATGALATVVADAAIVVDDVDEIDDVGASIFFFFDELFSTSGLLRF